MLISLKQLVTVSHRVNDQQPSSSQRTWFIAWLTILGLSHANLKIGATYLSKLRIMERIYFVYSSILKSHQIGEPMCLINLIRASLVKLIRSVAKPPIECCECQSIENLPFSMRNEWMNPKLVMATIRAEASAAASTSLSMLSCWWAPVPGPTLSHVIMNPNNVDWYLHDSIVTISSIQKHTCSS